MRTNPSNYYYFFEQLMKLSVGLVLATVLYFLPLRVFFKWKYVFFGLSIIGVLLLFTPLGIELNGSRAWLSLPG
ncbi:MAG: FtsW/RodA/SpoVE family cell cycle protein [Candidatus Peribacteria bacterium]|nr:MAG: FtsW/RodA/SpoVE family cell cycle protein [Candidatus Peribacteria bacterium]